MEVILRIEVGAERCRESHFRVSDHHFIGCLDPTSEATINLGPEDPFISRYQFMTEISNCLVRDKGSTKGVFIR
jgi:hypothetical protein